MRKGYSAITTLLRMTKKWKISLKEGGTFVALLFDFSEALDDLPDELLITKLHAYRVDILSLNFLH